MKKLLTFWGERYLYAPTFFDKFLSFLLLPLTGLYCLVVYYKYKTATPQDFGIPVVGIGNLVVGGSGKTPLTQALAKNFPGGAVVLRGYGRKSSGLLVVRDRQKILQDVQQAGDEAMIYATSLEKTIVIVSKNRVEGILKAKEMGAGYVLLDDAYSKHHIKKLELVIKTKTPNSFCLPSGALREQLWRGKNIHVIEENKEFVREVVLQNPTEKMVLLTAIARPQRLDEFLENENIVSKYYFPDHHFFTQEEIDAIIQKENPTSLVVTTKDFVKIAHLKTPKISLLDLHVELNNMLKTTVRNYIKQN